jgi:hypothetical protein
MQRRELSISDNIGCLQNRLQFRVYFLLSSEGFIRDCLQYFDIIQSISSFASWARLLMGFRTIFLVCINNKFNSLSIRVTIYDFVFCCSFFAACSYTRLMKGELCVSWHTACASWNPLLLIFFLKQRSMMVGDVGCFTTLNKHIFKIERH